MSYGSGFQIAIMQYRKEQMKTVCLNFSPKKPSETRIVIVRIREVFFKIQNWLLTSKVASKLKALEKGAFGRKSIKIKMMTNYIVSGSSM